MKLLIFKEKKSMTTIIEKLPSHRNVENKITNVPITKNENKNCHFRF